MLPQSCPPPRDGGQKDSPELPALASEAKTRAKLKRARVRGGFTCNLAERAGSRVKAWSRPVGMVDKVVSLGAELKACGFGHREALDHGQIPVLEVWLRDVVPHAALQIEGSSGGLGVKGITVGICGGEILGGAVGVAREAVHDLRIGAFHPDQSCTSCRSAARRSPRRCRRC